MSPGRPKSQQISGFSDGGLESDCHDIVVISNTRSRSEWAFTRGKLQKVLQRGAKWVNLARSGGQAQQDKTVTRTLGTLPGEPGAGKVPRKDN